MGTLAAEAQALPHPSDRHQQNSFICSSPDL